MRRNARRVNIANENVDSKVVTRRSSRTNLNGKEGGDKASSNEAANAKSNVVGIRKHLNRIPLRPLPTKENKPVVPLPRTRKAESVVAKDNHDDELVPAKSKISRPNSMFNLLNRVPCRMANQIEDKKALAIKHRPPVPKPLLTLRTRASRKDAIQSRDDVTTPLVDVSQILDKADEISFIERENLFPVPFADDLEDYSCPDMAFIMNERLRTEEKKYTLDRDYLSKTGVSRFTGRARANVLEWLIRTHAEFHFCTETLHIACQIFDRYMQKANDKESSMVRLSILTALYLASKLEETYIPALEDFVVSGARLFRKTDIMMMGIHMCRRLDYDLCSPNSLTFLRRYCKIARMNTKNHCFAKFLLELAMFDPVMVHWLPSFTASCALYVSRFVHQVEPYWNSCIEFHSGYSVQLVLKGSRRIAKMCTDYQNTSHKCVFTKYLHNRHLSVGAIAQEEAVQARLKRLQSRVAAICKAGPQLVR